MVWNHHRPGRVTLRTTGRSRRDGGYILVMFALLLVPLLLMAGFAMDIGYWYNRASDIRRAADAAALAGVVWLPDETKARNAALAAAAQNGFVPSSNIEISVVPSTKSERRLKVTIRDKRVGSFFYKSFAGRDIGLTRTSFAEYVLAVPMGSPRNFFGTGTLLKDYSGTGMPTEFLYQSVNPFCTDKVNGDRYQSGYFNSTTNGSCNGDLNEEYRSTGYSMYIEAQKNRTRAIEVRLYDARYSEADLTWQVQNGESCANTYSPAAPNWTTSGSSSNITITGPAEYQTRSSSSGSWSSTQYLPGGAEVTRAANRIRYRLGSVTWNPSTSGWIGPTSSSSTVEIDGWAEYQTRNSSSGSWSSTQTLVEGDSYSRAGNRLRYRLATINQTCTPVYETHTDQHVDDKRQSGNDSYTYTLFEADDTPLDDEDNRQICQKTFTPSSGFDGYEYLGSRRWNTLCTIAADAPSGRYVLRVTNSGAVSNPLNDGSNQWGLVAKYSGISDDGLCDGRSDGMCPRVYGKDAISVRAAADTSVASFYLAEIDRVHAGKKLKLELFDPGEGGSNIQIMRPSGTDGNTWTAASFSWQGDAISGSTSGNNVTSIDVTNNRFNGKLIEITIDLSGYNPPSNNQWWQIKYTFSGTVTDRTTWSARIIGDPVHLVEEY